jgi:SAM-dependent methyltransferase
MDQDRADSYILHGGEKGAERLRLLARVVWPITKVWLRQIGVRQGMHCLDSGCGIGSVTCTLARRVGPSGRVVGIDLDERCLDLARQEAARRNVPAVFRAKNITDLQEEGVYDLAYSRFLLSHLAEPARAVERLVRATRSGGLVAVEDVEFAGHFCYPACAAFDRYVSLYQRAVLARGGDPNIGPRLVGLLMDAGLAQVQIKVVQPTFRQGPGKRLAQVTMEHIGAAVVASGLASPGEVDAVVAELHRFAHNPRTILSLPRIFQVLGRRT